MPKKRLRATKNNIHYFSLTGGWTPVFAGDHSSLNSVWEAVNDFRSCMLPVCADLVPTGSNGDESVRIGGQEIGCIVRYEAVTSFDALFNQAPLGAAPETTVPALIRKYELNLNATGLHQGHRRKTHCASLRVFELLVNCHGNQNLRSTRETCGYGENQAEALQSLFLALEGDLDATREAIAQLIKQAPLDGIVSVRKLLPGDHEAGKLLAGALRELLGL